MAANDLIRLTPKGLYCEAGDFYIDPWRGVPQAIITHGHGDHARYGSKRYWATPETKGVMHARIDPALDITAMAYHETVQFGATTVSLHSAGHVLGSAQVRVEHDGEVWVASGDYKRDPDPTCLPFEVVPCDAFITEATFGLPAYRWRPMTEVAEDMYQWWQSNAAKGQPTVIFCYAFGKAQRILAELAEFTDQTVYIHGALGPLVQLYRDFDVRMLPTLKVSEVDNQTDFSQALALAPPSAAGSSWMRRFKNHRTGFASGWMRIRGNRRRRGYDRGFVVSDHADWPSLLKTITDTGAKRVLATHGKTDVLVRYLNEQGISAEPLVTKYGEGEDGEGDDN